MTKPGNVQMIFLHGQTSAMPVGKEQKLQKTFSVGITGARERRIKSVRGVGTHNATRIVQICFLFMNQRKIRMV